MPVFDPDQSPVIPSEPTVPTNVDSVPFAALENLVTAEQTQLLDLVNQLKNLGISEWIDLPQIIVVGSQSSGKSSVLEAISRIPFPRGDILCTTFATEVTLVRAPAQGTKVRLRAGTGATQEWEHYLQQFTVAGIDGNNADEVAKLITTARQYLLEGDRDDGANLDSFLKDTLCIECTDPAFPPLTLIDLPGLIQVPNERQTESDVETVRDMVRGYMNNPKSIILAIVSAASDLTEHTILKIVKEVDPSGKRTLGIITKPDTLPEGSNAQQAVLRLARNENSLWHLDLGWHVVRNRTWEERDTSLAERDTTEQAWFETGAWSHAVDRNCLGIRPLRDRLAKLLELQTRHYLPAVVGEIRQQLHKCEADLMKLGPARLTARAQRVYLVNTSERLKSLVQVATEGLYRHAFFTRLENRPYRIRARAHATNKAFTKVMQYRGHAMSITPTNDPDLRSTPAAYRAAAGRPAYQGLEVCLSMVRSIIDNTSGRELPGMFNPDVVREVFVIKSSKWAAIATAHVDEVWTGVKNALVAMTQYCANEGTSQRMMRVVISGALERKRELMNQKLDELLAPHLRCHPITYDPCFEDDVQSGCSNLLGRNEDSDDEEEASPNARPWTEEHALSYAEAYYKVP
jgi:GTP-binding protein EngB required for normal cell division